MEKEAGKGCQSCRKRNLCPMIAQPDLQVLALIALHRADSCPSFHILQVKNLTVDLRRLQFNHSQQRQQLEEQQALLQGLGRGSVPPPQAADASAPPLPEHDSAEKKAL